MPNFKIFQDNPDQARIKIFGNQNLALSQDSTGNLGITSTGLAITPPANGLAITSTGLAITPPAGGLMITSTGLAVQTATTDVSEVLANITDTAGSPDTTYNVLNLTTWSFGVVNASTTIAPATVKLQISPDGTNWLDNAGPVTLNTGDVTALVATLFLKYARIYYAAVNAASAVTLNIFFQGKA